MNVSLTPQLEKFVERKVKQGSYQTSSEVVRAALRMLADYDERRKLELDRLRREVKLGVDQIEAGLVTKFDAKTIKAEGRRRMAERKMKSAG